MGRGDGLSLEAASEKLLQRTKETVLALAKPLASPRRAPALLLFPDHLVPPSLFHSRLGPS